MLRRYIESSPHPLGKWCAYALLLLLPGSLIVLPVLWLVRLVRRHDGRRASSKRGVVLNAGA